MKRDLIITAVLAGLLARQHQFEVNVTTALANTLEDQWNETTRWMNQLVKKLNKSLSRARY